VLRKEVFWDMMLHFLVVHCCKEVEESRNWTVVHYLPSDTASHLRRMNSNATVRPSVLMVNCAADGKTYHAVW